MKEKTIALYQKIISNELISGSSYLFIGTTIANIFAFLFNLFLVRHLSYGDYAEFASLISLVTLASIPAQAFLPTIVQFAGRYFAKNQEDHAKELFRQASWKIGGVALLSIVGFFLFSPLLGNFLHIQNSIKFLLVGAVVAAIYLSVTNTAFLQSLLKFKFLAFTIITGGILKLLVGIGAITFGFGLYGILWGYFLTYFIPLLLTFFPLQFLLKRTVKETIHNKEIFAYGLPTAVAIFSLSSFTSTDILLVKHFFPSSTAALYSGLSLVGRIIFSFSLPISTAMFPLIVKRFHKGEAIRNLLLLSFFLVFAPSIVLTLLYFLFPKFIIIAILGKQYVSIAPFLGWFGLYLAVFSLLYVSVNFLLSVKKTSVSLFVLAGAIAQMIGISEFHANIGVVVGISLIICLVLFVLLLVYYQSAYANKKTAT